MEKLDLSPLARLSWDFIDLHASEIKLALEELLFELTSSAPKGEHSSQDLDRRLRVKRKAEAMLKELEEADGLIRIIKEVDPR